MDNSYPPFLQLPPGMKPVKCSAKDPSTCRFHGKKFTQQEIIKKQYFNEKKREAKEAQKHREFTNRVNIDLQQNLNLKTHKNGTTTCSVYRSGQPVTPKERGVEEWSYTTTDNHKPEGRQGRTTAVFAAPTLGGANRWVKGNSYKTGRDIRVNELTINVDTTYVYNVKQWEKTSSRIEWASTTEAETKELAEQYWNTGITMREYLTKLDEDPKTFDPQEWELLIPEPGVQSHKPVSKTRVAAHNYGNDYDRKEIIKILKTYDAPRKRKS